MKNLHEVNWYLIGSTQEYNGLKEDIAAVCRDVTDASCIDEICVADIVKTFEMHGFHIVPQDDRDRTKSVLKK